MDAAPFYRKAWFGTLGGALLFGIAYAWASGSSLLPLPALTFLLDAFLFCASLLFTIALASQFVLPVRTVDDRRQALSRAVSFLLRQHGPISIVENGRLAPVRGEDRGGAGVLFVDPASAAVLRTPTRFTRAVGPGLSFTAPGERVAEAIDVRRQVRSLEGRRPIPGDPAAPATAMALTGDGVPIAADLSVTFMLDPGHTLPPREGRSAQLPPYEVNLQAAERAAYGHAYGDGEHEDLPWAELPLRLAIDVWREEVKRHRLDELLDDRSAEPSPVRRLQDGLQARMVPTPASPSERSAAPQPTKEQQVLAARGIRVLSVSLGNLLLPERVQEGRMQRWRDSLGVHSGSGSAGSVRPGDLSPSSPDAAWADLTRSLETALAQDVSPGLQSTLQLILSEAVHLADQIDEPAVRQRVGDDIRAMASALGASPSARVGSSGEGGDR
jgi:regulator of protease activity HflC (stomatin/prohibitin superfamily)